MRTRDQSKPLQRTALLELFVLEMWCFLEHELAITPRGEDALQSTEYENVRSLYKDICRLRFEDRAAENRSAKLKVDNA